MEIRGLTLVVLKTHSPPFISLFLTAFLSSCGYKNKKHTKYTLTRRHGHVHTLWLLLKLCIDLVVPLFPFICSQLCLVLPKVTVFTEGAVNHLWNPSRVTEQASAGVTSCVQSRLGCRVRCLFLAPSLVQSHNLGSLEWAPSPGAPLLVKVVVASATTECYQA